jgi:hypothetical protein
MLCIGNETMERFNYSDLINRLEGFDPWLSSLGLTPRSNDRIHEAFKILRKAEEAIRRGRETGVYTNISPVDWFPMVEALEAHDVFIAFHHDQSPTIAATLKRALSGPIQPIAENQKNREGRNIWYELALAAEWRLNGASVCLGEPDLRLTRDGVTFLVACKRPANKESIQENMYNAVKQLQRNLDEAPDNFFGVAAISLSCTFNAGNQVFSGDLNGLGELLKIELDRIRPYLCTVHDPRICFALLQVATPGLGGNEVDLVRISFTVAQELTPSLGSKIFRQHAENMWPAQTAL